MHRRSSQPRQTSDIPQARSARQKAAKATATTRIGITAANPGGTFMKFRRSDSWLLRGLRSRRSTRRGRPSPGGPAPPGACRGGTPPRIIFSPPGPVATLATPGHLMPIVRPDPPTRRRSRHLDGRHRRRRHPQPAVGGPALLRPRKGRRQLAGPSPQLGHPGSVSWAHDFHNYEY